MRTDTMRTIHLRFGRAALLAACAFAASSCGEVARTGRSPAFLIIDSLQASSGVNPGDFGSTLNSDVVTLVEQTVAGAQVRVPTVFNDLGRATFRVGLKNPGTTSNPVSPSQLNEITITRYRVQFRRADGRNTPGVDVPYGFDGAVTVTVGSSSAAVGFEIVRHQMKQEPPLFNLRNSGGANVISTIAEVTFYGSDQAGNEVSVAATISVNFADFGDPQ